MKQLCVYYRRKLLQSYT